MTQQSDDEQRPSKAIDYALINMSYVGALAAVGVALHRQGGEIDLTAREVAVLTLATFTLADVFAHERIGTWMREPFDLETADHRPGRPRGRGLRYAIGELMACSRCLGSWSALGLVGLRVASPPAASAVTTVFAAAGANDFLQAAFRLLRARDNQLEDSA